MIKLTKKQQETVDRFRQLEEEHGQGNIFIRWTGDTWKTMFIIHKQGENNYIMGDKNKDRINGKILTALEEKGMLECFDVDHNHVDNANDAHHNGISVIGCRLKIA